MHKYEIEIPSDIPKAEMGRTDEENSEGVGGVDGSSKNSKVWGHIHKKAHIRGYVV